MIAKITSKNQLTLPKAAVEAVGVTEYFDVQVRDGQIVLTPVRIQRGDAVRAKLAALGLGEGDVADAVGFGSHAYFTTCFKAKFGITPTRFQAGCRPMRRGLALW